MQALSFPPAVRACNPPGTGADVRRTDVRTPSRGGRRVLAVPLLVLSSVAAAAWLRRSRASSGISPSGSQRSSSLAMASLPVQRIDTHLHVWASPEESLAFPYFPGQEPSILGSADFLLQNMVEANVSGALIIQPINHKFDHSYVTSVLQRFPDRFIGCCLADPTPGGGGVQELQRLVEKEGYRAVRFNPYLWPSNEKMTNAIGKSMFAKAGELGIPVGFMCFKGLLLHIDNIEELCTEYPDTKVMMDHFGFCKPPSNKEEEEAWEKLLSLSRFPQIYVKTSAFFRVSREPFPYADTWPLVRQLVDTFGANRVMWGSDFPFIVEQCGYESSWRVLPELGLEEEVLEEKERALVMGGTAKTLFPGAWNGRS